MRFFNVNLFIFKTKIVYKYLLFFLINTAVINSQELNNRLSFTIENDKLALLDQYYTSGLLISYTHSLENDFLFFKNENAKLQIEFTLLQQTYTPSNLISTDVLDFDRPYAGWLGFSTQVYSIKERRVIIVGSEIGVTGEQSGSGNIQTWWHNFLKIEVPTWEQEIGNKFLINLNAKYIYNLTTAKYSALDYKIETTIGLKNINIATGFDLAFGKLNNFNNASRIGVVKTNSNKEFYGVIGLEYKQAIHNALIQGDLNYNDTRYTTAITRSLLNAKTGIYYKNKRYLISLEYHFLSKETLIAFGQVYGSLTYACHF